MFASNEHERVSPVPKYLRLIILSKRPYRPPYCRDISASEQGASPVLNCRRYSCRGCRASFPSIPIRRSLHSRGSHAPPIWWPCGVGTCRLVPHWVVLVSARLQGGDVATSRRRAPCSLKHSEVLDLIPPSPSELSIEALLSTLNSLNWQFATLVNTGGLRRVHGTASDDELRRRHKRSAILTGPTIHYLPHTPTPAHLLFWLERSPSDTLPLTPNRHVPKKLYHVTWSPITIVLPSHVPDLTITDVVLLKSAGLRSSLSL